ncbi:MAG: BrnT family toxin, partial [Dehalococcoidia bacterium]
WDDGNLSHIARHGLIAVDVEGAVTDSRRIMLPEVIVNGERRTIAICATPGGRILVVVTTPRGAGVRVVTAYPADTRQRRRYRQAQ